MEPCERKEFPGVSSKRRNDAAAAEFLQLQQNKEFLDNLYMRTPAVIFLIIAAILLYTPVSNAALSRNLKLGDRGSDVRELQIALNLDPETKVAAIGPGSLGNETEFFGPLTQNAVNRFQQKHAKYILAPIGLTRPTGIFGSKTRLKLQSLYGTISTPVSSATTPAPASNSRPEITSITPNIITRSSEEITITGSNFTKINNTVITSTELPDTFKDLVSEDGKTIRFKFRSSRGDRIKTDLSRFGNSEKALAAIADNIQGRRSGVATAQIPLRMRVRNANGESNIRELFIDMTSILRGN